MKNERAEALYKRYLKGNCTPEEQGLVEQWYLQEIDKRQGIQKEVDEERVKAEIWAALPAKTESPAPGYRRWYAYAAAVLILLSAGLFFYLKQPQPGNAVYAAAIAPGGNKAFLTLADGSKISLTDAKNGQLAKQPGIIVTKTKDGQLIYTAAKDAGSGSTSSSNTITTPKGGQYRINLPDGTKVWLNAATSLKYPVQFASAERRVELNGEAYFEVAKNKYKPFKVATAKQVVEVLGTHFNISGYADERSITTTLLEGSVHVFSPETAGKDARQPDGLILKPGQQSVMVSDRLFVRQADTEEAIAWKNGLFMFSGQDLLTIMKQVERWYDVKVEFEDNALKNEVFKGTISRFKDISQLLEVLESTGSVHFKIEGRRITAMQ
jgi:transmembrane sensor